ncbi:phage holin family protein [Nakamurella endophytica]|uniref:Phage holin family protein n=1 Tax=Nakamurella endophytica TaxID=1748367 RepID=A0A917T105_9ACTN|nr:phage holin family protein [Nakamurella endophytica]GGM05382.1 hypothetical protein GCM10011594_27020 [Nakamurella endophytica]
MPGVPQRPASSVPATGARPVIPLTAEPIVDPSESIGALVKDATVHMSTLVRSEIELAKLEITESVKTGVRGAVFFIGAAVIGLFSMFFFWFMVGEILAIWLPRWLAFTIVFVAMLLMAGLLALLGLRKVKQIRKPERTISSLTETAATLKSAATHSSDPSAAAR